MVSFLYLSLAQIMGHDSEHIYVIYGVRLQLLIRIILMGSRITRVLFKQQRKKPIKKQQQADIKVLIACFLGSINTIYFFLFGYLFRPHIRAPDSLAIFLTILILFFYFQLRQVKQATLITSIALFLAVIIMRVVAVELSLLKAVLILITTALSAVSSFQIGSSPFLQALFLWLAYSSFGLGVRLSLAVSKIKIQNSQLEAVGREESLLVQIVFSLIGIMSIVLISVGKRILKLKPNDSQKQTTFGKQYIYASLNFLLIAFSFGYKSDLQHSFVFDLIGVLAALITFLICKKLLLLDYAWIMIFSLAAITFFIDFLAENEPQISEWINFSKILMLDLGIIDCLQKWISWSSSGTHRSILIVFIFFSSFYLSQFSSIGIKLLSNFTPICMEAISLSLYVVLQALHRFDRANAQAYEEVVV